MADAPCNTQHNPRLPGPLPNRARVQLAAHMRDALRTQRPLLVRAILAHGPPERREALHSLVLRYMADAAAGGLPVAGGCGAWGVAGAWPCCGEQ